MNRNESLAEEYYSTIFGDPWYGSSVKSILEVVTKNNSKVKIAPNTHSIEEILLHMWSWTEEVNSRLCGGLPKEPVMEDWPKLSDFQKLSWAELKKQFFNESKSIISTIKNFPEERLDETVGIERNAPLGTGISFASMISGLIQHNVYHAAQISLLNKCI